MAADIQQNLNCVERGNGRPVLVLHGGKLDHRHMLDAVEPAFVNTDGWRRVYLDLPGCGASPGGADIRSQDDVLERVISFARAKDVGHPWAVIGESRGSYIAQGMAHCAPEMVAGVCLIVPGGYPTEPPAPVPDPVSIISAAERLEELEPAVRDRAARLVVQSPALFEKIRDFKLPAADLHDRELEARVERAFLFSFHAAMLAATFSKPSLIVSGRQDSISGYTDTLGMLECYPRATFGLLDTAGHSLSWERPELVASLLRDWLRRLEQG